MDNAEAHQTTVLLSAIEGMETTLSVAAALVGEGRRIDLDGLEAEMERICSACLVTPRRIAPALRGRLSQLLNQLDHLRGAFAPP